MDELLADDRVTLWGLFVESYAYASRHVVADLEEATGVPASWFEVLLRVGRTPGQAVPMTRLAEMVLLSSGGFSKLADRMVAAGLVRRAPSPDDRRSSLVVLTPKGRRLLRRGLAAHLPSLDRHVVGHLGERDSRELARLLRRVRDGNVRSAG